MTKLLLIACSLSLILLSNCSKNAELAGPANQVSFDNVETHTDTVFRINDIIQLPDSSFILAGGASLNGGNFQNLIMKYSLSGIRIWARIRSNSDSPKGYSRIFQINANKFSAYRDIGFSYDPSPRIVDYDAGGNLVFQNFVNTSITMHGLEYFNSLYYAAGEKNKVMAYQEIKPDGTSVWIKFYLSAPAALSISQLPDSAFVTIGGGNTSQPGKFLYKINTSGDTLWTKSFSGFAVKGLPDGSFLAVTGTGSSVSLDRFNPDGKVMWENTISGVSGSSFETGSFNILDFDSRYFVFTVLKDDGFLYLYEYSTSGSLINTLKITGIQATDQVALAKTMDNGFILVKSNLTPATQVMELIKYAQVTP